MDLITEEQINESGRGLLSLIQGHKSSFDSVHSPEAATEKSLVFISDVNLLNLALANKATGFIIHEKKFPELRHLLLKNHTVWTTPHIQQAMSRVLNLFNPHQLREPSGIHTTAIIHPKAQVSKLAHIGPYVVIQENAVVKENVKIGSHCVVEAYAEIGAQTILNPHVVVGSYCQVGAYCLIASHVTIGSDGFGFFTDKEGHHKIPQIGRVIIEDHCEIGAGTAIDRATLETTRIKRGSKLDNHCHIAHNVEIGENALLAAAFKTAGSTKFGKNLMTGGNVDVNGHIEIGDNVILIGRSGVIGSLSEPGIFGGFPAEPHKNNIKNLAAMTHLSKMRKQLQKIMKHLNLQE